MFHVTGSQLLAYMMTGPKKYVNVSEVKDLRLIDCPDSDTEK